jgi:hypothetical protein
MPDTTQQHPHDVLSRQGRGKCPYDQHAGNIQFRAWVAERSTSYCLASPAEKKLIIREVIALVHSQNPPGRFLRRGATHDWWNEADDRFVVQKTGTAFRRGAEKSATVLLAKTPIDDTAPARMEDLGNADEQVRRPSNEYGETEDAIAPVISQETARIHTPHPHDVLSGRVGVVPIYQHDVLSGHGVGVVSIYHHAGNIQCRAWVSERQKSYRIAPNNEKKTLITREVIALVQNQNPPGRFLKRDPVDADRWMEVDDGRALRRIRDALRQNKYKPSKDPSPGRAVKKRAARKDTPRGGVSNELPSFESETENNTQSFATTTSMQHTQLTPSEMEALIHSDPSPERAVKKRAARKDPPRGSLLDELPSFEGETENNTQSFATTTSMQHPQLTPSEMTELIHSSLSDELPSFEGETENNTQSFATTTSMQHTQLTPSEMTALIHSSLSDELPSFESETENITQSFATTTSMQHTPLSPPEMAALIHSSLWDELPSFEGETENNTQSIRDYYEYATHATEHRPKWRR